MKGASWPVVNGGLPFFGSTQVNEWHGMSLLRISSMSCTKGKGLADESIAIKEAMVEVMSWNPIIMLAGGLLDENMNWCHCCEAMFLSIIQALN